MLKGAERDRLATMETADAPHRTDTRPALQISRVGQPVDGKQNRVDLAYEAIKRAILENVFPPGYQAGEVEIARQLAMSRTPVHEAMARLQEEGLVRILARRGILVCGLSPTDIEEIYDVIIALEGAAAERLAALEPGARAQAVTKLEAATAEMARALEANDLLEWARFDEAFHDDLVAECGNGRLQRMAGTVRDQLHRARMFTLNIRPLPANSAIEHRTLISAIEAGDVETASLAARKHRQHARDQLVPLLSRLKLNNL